MYNYQFSISQNGRFLFRTELISSIDHPQTVYNQLVTRFPKTEGFIVTVNKFTAAYNSEDHWF